MCLLITQSKNSKVSNKKLGNAWNRNHDGVGYAFADNGKIKVRKYMEFKPFKKDFNNDVKMYGSKSSFLIHFRFATHGKTDLTNVHPFKVNDGLVFGHNGVINDVETDIKLSDTQVFNNIVLKNLDNSFLQSETLRLLIKSFIGNSKLAFLDVNGKIDIINEEAGIWSDDKKIWFSNDGFKKQKTYFVNGGHWNGLNTQYNHNIKYYGKSKSEQCNLLPSENDTTLADNELLKCSHCDMKVDKVYNENGKQFCQWCYHGSPLGI